ncbi:MAG: hypothetical protein IJB98_02660, partial [Clostridia bacterium]|nr:hypothetical protein [Clostridia bacterium]
ATHGFGPVCQALNIHRGNRLTYLVCMDTKSVAGLAVRVTLLLEVEQRLKKKEIEVELLLLKFLIKLTKQNLLKQWLTM